MKFGEINGPLYGISPLRIGSEMHVTGSIVTTEHFAGEVQSITASGTDISNITHMTLLTSVTGEYTANLSDGLHVGQIKHILVGDVTNAMVAPMITITANTVRPVMGNTWTSLDFDPGDAAMLVWTSTGWSILGHYGVTVNYPM